MGSGSSGGVGETAVTSAPFSKRSACQVSLNKNHIGWGGIEGIHPAILMNCAAQAFLNAALVSSI